MSIRNVRPILILAAIAGAVVVLRWTVFAPGPYGHLPQGVRDAREKVDAMEAARVARQPTDPKLVALIRKAEPYYSAPKFVWDTCRECADRLNAQGYVSSTAEIVDAAEEVMRRLDVRPIGDQSLAGFCSTYEGRRIDPARADGRQGPASHREAVELLVEYRKFANDDGAE